MFGVIGYPCNGDMSTWNNGASVICVYMKYNVQCTKVSSVLDDTSTSNIKVCVIVIQVCKITVMQCNRISV